jgi:drug/metabolite transporter (DMT)-like permease
LTPPGATRATEAREARVAWPGSHRSAVAWMVACTLMWSIAGVVTRHVEMAQGAEVAFWRSAFNALALVLLLAWLRGPSQLWRTLRTAGPPLWLSGLCWCVMFTAFMVAITRAQVANVLVAMAVGPLMAALASRWWLGHRLPPRTWVAVAVAGIGIAWMFGHELGRVDSGQIAGMLIALLVPLAGTCNWILLQWLHAREMRPSQPPAPDMLPAVLVGAVMSALLTLPFAWPLAANAHDLRLLALLGVVQLAIPCLIVTALTRVLKAPEISLLALLEVVFGVAWAWAWGGETPAGSVLAGGALVLGALATHEALALRTRVPPA